MKGYKAFKKGMICSPYGNTKQYAENTVFEEPEASLCHCGMHFCENPLDVLDFFPLIDDNGDLFEVAEVEALDTPVGDGKKYCTKKLRIGAKLTLPLFIRASIDFLFEKAKIEEGKDTDTDTDTDTDAASVSKASDERWSKLAASGYGSKLAASGYGSQLAASGKRSVVAAIGPNSIAKAAEGCWITLAEWGLDNEASLIPLCVKTCQVDGKTIKADTFYKLINGEFVEVKENG